MLRKLLKYEFKATGRLLFPLYIVLIAFSFINKLFMGDILTSETPSFLGELPRVLSMIMYIATMVAIFVVTFFITAQRYYKNLLGDEGYLMNTLPVKTWQNIASKLIVAIVWSIASVFVAIVSVLIMAYEKGVLTELFKDIPMVFSDLYTQAGMSGYLIIIQVILLLLISYASAILMVYASISLGHLFNKRKILCSFGAYIVLSMVSQTLAAVCATPFIGVVNTMDPINLVNLVLLLVNIGNIVLGVAYFITCNYITKNKLNLE
ncbi:ABC transporter permease [Clostridium paraputrificum]|uniref:ABC transporter permease n=1 Tax=Clostridium TaxID=1485 RepID=UPI003D33BEA9